MFLSQQCQIDVEDWQKIFFTLFYSFSASNVPKTENIFTKMPINDVAYTDNIILNTYL